MMPERRPPTTASTSQRSTTTSVRRNLFHQHLSRRPTTSSTSTSAETLRLDMDPESSDSSSEIVIRDQNGNFEIGDVGDNGFDVHEEGGADDALEEERERRKLADAVRNHQRDRNRAPSEPAELLESVKTVLRAKVAALAEDNWMYEAEEDGISR